MTHDTAPVPPGGTLGILGGGQLGRMIALAAARLGIRAVVLAPEADPPAGHVCRHIRADYTDREALDALADSADAVTVEFENVPDAALHALAPIVPVRPGARAFAIARDRLNEKTFVNDLGIGTAPFQAVDKPADLVRAAALIGTPAILKTRQFGYDGKGQAKLAASDPAALDAAMREIGTAPAILEGFVDFAREVSVIVARGVDGTVAAYDPVENVHRNHILHTSTVPAALTDAQAAEAVRIAESIVTALDYVGVMGVEMFVARDGGLLVNEIAPRVHNSGHWTLEACAVSQFEQHVRAVCGWPLGSPARHSGAVMTNLIGDEAHAWREIAAEPGAALHLYGKTEARAGRKMGHVTRLTGPSPHGR
ncbi:MAG: 5-(carboxyamino)imidazole ribonucleotide synthase [Alphaproteobacteria bacterium]|nr:5-(carboxyamino)imidazole ribonucleotide synthase [Alphaproteobacteria bacterium]MDX5367971.1 5-(carboxyamino)imidazole ribonucleotide synthase [Alphaproteobacteria bacterium]MDX5462824.1 5-(carboxyamino)imidazole ribonucleotide synthase [Alphaproteobacteria bacterium]